MSDTEPDAVDLQQLFKLLGNETRMGIMRALWEGFEFQAYVTGSQEGTRFGTLRERVGVEDTGNFNYHLGELDGVLVENRDDGYVLTPLGYNLMRAIDQYSSSEFGTVDEWTVADPCPFCGGDLAAEYRRQILEVRCRDCGGMASGGNFTFVVFRSGSAQDLDRREILDAAILLLASKVRSSMRNICWSCNARLDVDIEHCEHHERDASGVCQACDHRYRAEVHASCPGCGAEGRGPVVEYAVFSPSVDAFFARADLGSEQVGPWQYRLHALDAVTEVDSPAHSATVELVFSLQGDSLRVSIATEPSGVSVVCNAD